jgi:hypothetical protein
MPTQPRERLYRVVNRELEQTSLNLLLILNGRAALDVPARATPARGSTAVWMQSAVTAPWITAFCIQNAVSGALIATG